MIRCAAVTGRIESPAKYGILKTSVISNTCNSLPKMKVNTEAHRGLRGGRVSRSGGFTIIELVVVIIILSILAAAALPRFSNMQTQARIAKLNGALGAMKAASALAHASCLASSPQCSATLQMEGASITMVHTYPTANAAGIVSAAGISAGAGSTDGYEVQGGGAAAGSTMMLKVTGNDPVNCSVTYTAPIASGQAPAFGTLVTSGC